MAAVATGIACVVGADSTATQILFARLAADWRASGIKAVGLIGEPHGLPNRACGAGILRDIVSGTAYSIYLATAPRDTSCHIDMAGVETACAAIIEEISAADLVVLSKFGKLEAIGRGLTGAFEAAIAAGKPLLTSVSAKHLDAWRAFAPHATSLSLDETVIKAWSRAIFVACP